MDTNTQTTEKTLTAEELYATRVINAVKDLYAANNTEPRTYTNNNGDDVRVYAGNGKHFKQLHRLSSRQDIGDKSMSIQVESKLGSTKFDYTDNEGYKFLFCVKRANSIEIHMAKPSDDLDIDADELDDIDLEW